LTMTDPIGFGPACRPPDGPPPGRPVVLEQPPGEHSAELLDGITIAADCHDEPRLQLVGGSACGIQPRARLRHRPCQARHHRPVSRLPGSTLAIELLKDGLQQPRLSLLRVPQEECFHLGVGGRIARRSSIGQQGGQLVGKYRHRAGADPAILAAGLRPCVDRGGKDDGTVLPPDVTPTAPETAGAVAEHPPGGHTEHVMPPAGDVRPRALKRSGAEVLAEHLRHRLRLIDIDDHETRTTTVQRKGKRVVRDEPVRDVPRVAARLLVPSPSKFRSRVLRASLHWQHIETGRGVSACSVHEVHPLRRGDDEASLRPLAKFTHRRTTDPQNVGCGLRVMVVHEPPHCGWELRATRTQVTSVGALMGLRMPSAGM
jgi:hypothetical protein